MIPNKVRKPEALLWNHTAPLLLALSAIGCNSVLGFDDFKMTGSATDGSGGGGGQTSATGGQAGSSGHPSAESCTLNQECTTRNGNMPSICRKSDNTCVLLTSQDCSHVVGDYLDDNAILLGSIETVTGDNASAGIPLQNAMELGIDDFQTATFGLPAATPGGKRRPLAFVGCDETVNGIRAAKHLVNDVQVPAIVGGTFSGDTKDILTQVTADKGVLLMSSSATAPILTSLDPRHLFWRTCPSDLIQAKAVSLLIPQLEAQIKATAKPAPQNLRLAILYKDDNYGKGLSTGDALRIYTINGKNVLDPANGDAYFRTFDYGNPDDMINDPNPTAIYAQKVSAALQFLPHIVIIVGGTETFKNIMTGLENGWAAATSAQPPPYYIFTDGGYDPGVVDVVNKSPAPADIRKRIFGTNPGTSNSNYNTFVNYYKGKFTDSSDPTVAGVAGAYDALYLIAYAITALGNQPVTGLTIVEGLKKLVPPGQNIDVGSSGITDALSNLTQGNHIDFNGASGPLNFDITKGEAPSDIQIWCVKGDSTTGKATMLGPSVEHYDAASQSLVGSLACPLKAATPLPWASVPREGSIEHKRNHHRIALREPYFKLLFYKRLGQSAAFS